MERRPHSGRAYSVPIARLRKGKPVCSRPSPDRDAGQAGYSHERPAHPKTFSKRELLDFNEEFTGMHCTQIDPSHSVLLEGLLLYRPPGPRNDFLLSWPTILEYLILALKTIVLGDFNLHLEDQSDPVIRDFLSLMSSLEWYIGDLTVTHRAGHMLDGIFLRHENRIRPDNMALDWSDHHFLSFRLIGTGAASKICPVSRLIRPWHRVQETNLARALQSGWDQVKAPVRSTLEIFDLGIRLVIDTVTPMVPSKPKPGRCLSTPWFAKELKSLQRIYHRQKRKWLLNKTSMERDKLRSTLADYKQAIRSAKTEYIICTIKEAQSEQKELFKIICSLTIPPPPSSLENSETFC
ncbi:hypothetical protein NDU88_010178 [Pleurodeles waltl]|uniref:Endonuclease/exonuclease/phosphatase domain-containing protein n=1 Tax=Pleurodeles waltl TaxID=8319 RepID=A0AAV7QXB7_PLEWA|nr:hypothetical protein NDU88_010178 [Pleurodeles waltl]